VATTVTAAVVIKTGYVSAPNAQFTVTPTAAFDVFYQIDGGAPTATKPTYLPAGSTLDVILKVKGSDIALDSDATADKVTVGVVTGTNLAPKSIACSKTSVVDNITGGVLTFVKTSGAKLEIGETVTVTYEIGNADLSATNAISIVYSA
jgi:hypothetical protein